MRPSAASVLLLAFAAALPAQPPGRRSPIMRPLVMGRHWAAAAMHPLAVAAAEQIFQAGGNAFDAVVAGQAALGVVIPASNGIGGDAMLLVWDAKARKAVSINAAGTAPRLATIDWYKQHQGGKLPVNEGLLAGTVPGVVDAWYLLLDRWGTKNFAEVLAPAIDLAANGYPLTRNQSEEERKRFEKYPTTVRVLFPEGRALRAGELYRNPDLARTLRTLVDAEKKARRKGRHAALKAARDEFYKGSIARTMARFSEENGGLFRYQDFASYSAKVEEPVWTDYRGYRVYKNPSANQGPSELMALNILENYDLRAMGHNSAAYIHANVEALKLAFADREKYLGDQDFVQIPYERLLSKAYARERQALLDPEKASLELRPGEAPGGPLDVTFGTSGDHEGDTSYIVVGDAARNLVSFIPSLHSGYGTRVVMADLGFSFNCRGDYFSLVEGHANALAPGKRPRVTLQSTLVARDGKPFLATGSPGGDDQCQRTIQTLLNIVDFGMNLQQAIEAPRWSTRGFPSSPFPHTMYPGDLSVEDRIPEAVREALRRRGHKVRAAGPWSMNMTAAIQVHPESGVLVAGADPRVSAYAVAW